jgi:hypothetical protein
MRVVLRFDPPHPEFGAEFGTDYFKIEQPGVLSWGFEGRSFRIEPR